VALEREESSPSDVQILGMDWAPAYRGRSPNGDAGVTGFFEIANPNTHAHFKAFTRIQVRKATRGGQLNATS
jgi:hypothetical protein